MQQSLAPMVGREPELAAKLLVQALPAATKSIKDRLAYGLIIDDVGSYHVSVDNGRATVTEMDDETAPLEKIDFELRTDARTFAGLGMGESQIMAVLKRRIRIRGRIWRALKLRKLDTTVTLRDVANAGADPELLYRAMRYAIEPQWQGRPDKEPR